MKEKIKNLGNTWIPIAGIVAITYLIHPMAALYSVIGILGAFVFAPLFFDLLDWSWNKLFKKGNDNE